LLGSFHLGLDGLADLYDFGLNELGVPVALGVVLDENFGGLFGAVLGDEETGRFREEASVVSLEPRLMASSLTKQWQSGSEMGRSGGGKEFARPSWS
jgi:hypothetical protein